MGANLGGGLACNGHGQGGDEKGKTSEAHRKLSLEQKQRFHRLHDSTSVTKTKATAL